jgi:hypothetical protein
MYSADRATHLKILVVGFLCAIIVAIVGISSHVGDIDLGTAPLVKAHSSTVVTGELPAVR